MPAGQRIALVTGVRSGIGRAVSLELKSRGFYVVGIARTEASARASLSDAGCTNAYAIDFADYESVSSHLLEIYAQVAIPEIVIHAAGISKLSLFEELSTAELEQLYFTNVLGTIGLLKSWIQAAHESGSCGRFIYISTSATIPTSSPPFVSTYASTKAAVSSLFYDLRKELVNSPVELGIATVGGCDTPMFSKLLDDLDATQRTAGPHYSSQVAMAAEVFGGAKGHLPKPSELAVEIVEYSLSAALEPEVFVPQAIAPALNRLRRMDSALERRVLDATTAAEQARILATEVDV